MIHCERYPQSLVVPHMMLKLVLWDHSLTHRSLQQRWPNGGESVVRNLRYEPHTCRWLTTAWPIWACSDDDLTDSEVERDLCYEPYTCLCLVSVEFVSTGIHFWVNDWWVRIPITVDHIFTEASISQNLYLVDCHFMIVKSYLRMFDPSIHCTV